MGQYADTIRKRMRGHYLPPETLEWSNIRESDYDVSNVTRIRMSEEEKDELFRLHCAIHIMSSGLGVGQSFLNTVKDFCDKMEEKYTA